MASAAVALGAGSLLAAQPAGEPTGTPAPARGPMPEYQPAPKTTTKLITAGDAKTRRTLRMTPKAGATTDLRITSMMKMTRDGVSREQLPGAVMLGTWTISSADSSGDYAASLTMKTLSPIAVPSTPKEHLEAFDAASKSLAGITLLTKYTSRGIAIANRTETPESAGVLAAIAAELLPQPSDTGVALPRDPVGIGAKWKATSTVSLHGIDAERVSTYHLREIRDGRFLLDATTTISGKGKATADEFDRLFAAPIRSIEGTMKGTLEVSPELGVCTRCDLKGTTTTQLHKAEGRPSLIVAELAVTVEPVEPAKPAPPPPLPPPTRER